MAIDYIDSSSGAVIVKEVVVSSNVSEVVFTGLNGAFSKYELQINDGAGSVDGFFQMQLSTDNGSTYLSGASAYAWAAQRNTMRTVADANRVADEADSKIQLTAIGTESSTAPSGLSGTISMYGLGTDRSVMMEWGLVNSQALSTLINVTIGGAAALVNANHNALRIYMSTGSIASGIYILRGIK